MEKTVHWGANIAAKWSWSAACALPAVALELAIAEITRDRSTLPLTAANQDVYKLIKDGVKVKFKDEQGRNREETVRVMDWEVPTENDFLLVS